jgi:hypothetical protein
MGQKQKWWGSLLLACWGVAACDQELVIPRGMNEETKPVVDARSDGFTGVGGAGDETAPAAPLPISNEPVFTDFGGAGGLRANADEAGAAEQPAVPRAGAPATGGMKGTGGSAGAKPAGGTTGRPVGGEANGGEANGGEANGGGAAMAPALLFSEYVEGSGSFKALEICALGASSLEGCELQTYSNGKLEPSRLALHGELAPGKTQVLCSSALALQQPNLCDRSTSLIFNGNDALALSCGGEQLDVIGQVGVDPGEAWGAGTTLDHTLRRRCEVTAGRRDGSSAFEVDAEWLVLGVDTFSDLGVRNCSP